jgi:hypothetical protein
MGYEKGKILTETTNEVKLKTNIVGKSQFLINRRIKGFHVTHFIDASHASSI